MTIDLLPIIEATVLRLEPGDILLVKLTEDALQEPDLIESVSDGFKHALAQAGRTEDVGVLLTTDGIGLTIIRPDTEADLATVRGEAQPS